MATNFIQQNINRDSTLQYVTGALGTIYEEVDLTENLENSAPASYTRDITILAAHLPVMTGNFTNRTYKAVLTLGVDNTAASTRNFCYSCYKDGTAKSSNPQIISSVPASNKNTFQFFGFGDVVAGTHIQFRAYANNGDDNDLKLKYVGLTILPAFYLDPALLLNVNMTTAKMSLSRGTAFATDTANSQLNMIIGNAATLYAYDYTGAAMSIGAVSGKELQFVSAMGMTEATASSQNRNDATICPYYTPPEYITAINYTKVRGVL